MISIETAFKIAEYLALASSLKENDPAADYRRANQLSWELAMCLHESLYKEVVMAIAAPTGSNNPLTVVVSVRKMIMRGMAGELTQDRVAHHAPGIGAGRHQQQEGK